jgi:hypothetical protein
MKQIILFTLAVFAMGVVNAQTATQSETREKQMSVNDVTSKTPTATVSYTNKPQPSQLILKVKSLCQGDDVLTEMVIAEIYKRKNLQTKDVIADAEFKRLARDEQNEWVCESEVNEIINQLKR